MSLSPPELRCSYVVSSFFIFSVASPSLSPSFRPTITVHYRMRDKWKTNGIACRSQRCSSWDFQRISYALNLQWNHATNPLIGPGLLLHPILLWVFIKRIAMMSQHRHVVSTINYRTNRIIGTIQFGFLLQCAQISTGVKRRILHTVRIICRMSWGHLIRLQRWQKWVRRFAIYLNIQRHYRYYCLFC